MAGVLRIGIGEHIKSRNRNFKRKYGIIYLTVLRPNACEVFMGKTKSYALSKVVIPNCPLGVFKN
jgi:hypothetical protein